MAGLSPTNFPCPECGKPREILEVQQQPVRYEGARAVIPVVVRLAACPCVPIEITFTKVSPA